VNLTTHSTKTALQRLLPNAKIGGGSFVDELPQPSRLSPTEARSKLKKTREEALSLTLNDLKNDIGFGEQFPPRKTHEGYRIWPDGYTGSLTYKGSILLGALVPNRDIESLGIDLEFDRNGGKGLSHVVNDGEIPDHTDSKSSTLGVFSSKESIYKAHYPIEKNEFGFEDVYIDWVETSPSLDYGIASCPNSVEIEVQCFYQGKWIVSTAQLLDHN